MVYYVVCLYPRGGGILCWLCRFVVRDFVYNDREMLEERQEHTRLLEEKKMQFVSFAAFRPISVSISVPAYSTTPYITGALVIVSLYEVHCLIASCFVFVLSL